MSQGRSTESGIHPRLNTGSGAGVRGLYGDPLQEFPQKQDWKEHSPGCPVPSLQNHSCQNHPQMCLVDLVRQYVDIHLNMKYRSQPSVTHDVLASCHRNLENIMPVERSHSPKSRSCIIPLLGTVRNRKIYRDRVQIVVVWSWGWSGVQETGLG